MSFFIKAVVEALKRFRSSMPLLMAMILFIMVIMILALRFPLNVVLWFLLLRDADNIKYGRH